MRMFALFPETVSLYSNKRVGWFFFLLATTLGAREALPSSFRAERLSKEGMLKRQGSHG